jgi:hypothetical protein
MGGGDTSFVYLLVMLLVQSGGFMDNILALIPNSECLKIVIIKLTYIKIGTSFVYLLLLFEVVRV